LHLATVVEHGLDEADFAVAAHVHESGALMQLGLLVEQPRILADLPRRRARELGCGGRNIVRGDYRGELNGAQDRAEVEERPDLHGEGNAWEVQDPAAAVSGVLGIESQSLGLVKKKIVQLDGSIFFFCNWMVPYIGGIFFLPVSFYLILN
jgi:hypothetical protein